MFKLYIWTYYKYAKQMDVPDAVINENEHEKCTTMLINVNNKNE